MQNIIFLFSALFGLIVGSFLNALIYRLPKGINIATPRSSCPQCNHVISWYENIPVLSYLILKGKCAHCGSRISIQYPVIEIVTGLFAFFVAPRSLDSVDLYNSLFYFAVFCALLVHFVVDLKHRILPDSVNIYLALLFFVVSMVLHPWSHWLLGGVIGLGFPLIVSWIFYKLKGQVGLGGGDIKLYGALGLYLGPLGILQNLFLSCFLGAIVGIILMVTKVIKKENPIPFGPFIIIVASAQIFADKWFQHLLGYIP